MRTRRRRIARPRPEPIDDVGALLTSAQCAGNSPGWAGKSPEYAGKSPEWAGKPAESLANR